jgi:hypothetical protein
VAPNAGSWESASHLLKYQVGASISRDGRVLQAFYETLLLDRETASRAKSIRMSLHSAGVRPNRQHLNDSRRPYLPWYCKFLTFLARSLSSAMLATLPFLQFSIIRGRIWLSSRMVANYCHPPRGDIPFMRSGVL